MVSLSGDKFRSALIIVSAQPNYWYIIEPHIKVINNNRTTNSSQALIILYNITQDNQTNTTLNLIINEKQIKFSLNSMLKNRIAFELSGNLQFTLKKVWCIPHTVRGLASLMLHSWCAVWNFKFIWQSRNLFH